MTARASCAVREVTKALLGSGCKGGSGLLGGIVRGVLGSLAK
jgi:hypothetical protein